MTTVTQVEHPDAVVTLEDAEPGKRRLRVVSRRPHVYIHRDSCLTAYPDDLIRLILEVKGPGFLCDEVMREESPNYIQRHLELTVAAHLDPADLAGRRLLDFGCGAGASTTLLGRLLPQTEIVGVDLNEGNLRIARARTEFYKLGQTTLLLSPGGDTLPEGLGKFDAVMLSAVFEHLLAPERKTLMPVLWDLITPGGVLFLDETPARWFPLETHTTGLFGINYLPDMLAGPYARLCSGRVGRHDSWETLCRNGVRGTSLRGILRTLPRGRGEALVLPPSRLGIKNRVDLWYEGYASAETGRVGILKRSSVHLLRAASAVLGTPLVPYLSVAVRKRPPVD
jgi:SAM-dependent methyltransferase